MLRAHPLLPMPPTMQVDPEWQLRLLDCVRSTVGADAFEELLLMSDSSYQATAAHRACANSHEPVVRWMVGESLAGLELLQPPPPLDDATVRCLLTPRTLHGWMLYHESARCGRIEITAVVLRAMRRVFGWVEVSRALQLVCMHGALL